MTKGLCGDAVSPHRVGPAAHGSAYARTPEVARGGYRGEGGGERGEA